MGTNDCPSAAVSNSFQPLEYLIIRQTATIALQLDWVGAPLNRFRFINKRGNEPLSAIEGITSNTGVCDALV